MIFIINGFKIGLDYKEENKSYIIYTYERIILNSEYKILVSLPYLIKTENFKYLNFELDYKLCEKGIKVLWTNLNEESNKNSLKFLLRNDNIVHRDEITPLTNIIGNRIDIIPNTVFGKIFI